MTLWAGLALYAAGWASFGLAHSLLAREPARAALRRIFGHGMRLAWNATAALHLGLVLWLGHAVVPALAPAWPGWFIWVRLLPAAGGLALLFAARRSYDLGRLLGTTQLLGGAGSDDEPFSVRGPLRSIRHPLYTGALLLLLAGVADLRSATTWLLAFAYILVGLRFEERALLRRLGPQYARYRATVPALLPWPGRAWREGG